MASPNVHSAAQKMGWYNPENEVFDFTKSYAFGNGDDALIPLYGGRRMWRIYSLVAPDHYWDPNWGFYPQRISYPFSTKGINFI